jgi:dTDP-4-dehydrorhamnose reductase
VPISTTEHSSFARRPKNSLLSCQRFLTTFGFQLAPWQQQLNEVLAEMMVESAVETVPGGNLILVTRPD